MNPNHCPTCHSPILPDAPGGFCAACLLRDAEEELSTVSHEAPSVELVAAAFPKLEVLEFVGQGGMGFVYKVRQPGLDRIVALKILSPALSRDPAFEERFSREARVLGQLQHPNIVTVFEHGEEGGFFYFLMEYIDGINLRQAMQAGRFTPEQALEVMPGICDALQAAHAQGICHRDIKPENILLDREGRVKIVDFGIALIGGDSQRNFTLTATGGGLGSAAYMAPEQHERPHEVDHRADIYSLGVVLYEMLTGELPLGRFPAPSERAQVNQRVDEIVFRTLEKERDLRQQSATEVKTEVTEVGSGALSDQPKEPRVAEHGLPRSVASAIALWIGGATVWIFGDFFKNEIVMSVGCGVFMVGFMGCLWALWEMKKGQALWKGRGVLITATIIPMCMAIIAWIVIYGDFLLRFSAREGGLLVGGISILLIAFSLFWVALFIGRPLRSSPNQCRTFGKSVLLLAGMACIAGGGIYSKYGDGKWPMVGEQTIRTVRIDDQNCPLDSELEKLVERAAGEYSDDYRIKVDQGEIEISVMCLDSEFASNIGGGTRLSAAHVKSFFERLSQLIPSEQLHLEDFHISESINRRVESLGIWRRVSGLLVLGALLVCIVGGKRSWMVMGYAVIALGILAILPAWKHDSAPPRLIKGPPLEPFDASELVSPEVAMKSLLKAARNGNLKDFQKGLSKSFLADWSGESVGDFGKVKFVEVTRVEGAVAEILVEATDGSNRRVTFVMVLEAGQWKLNGDGL